MNWKTLSVIALILAVTMAVGFGYEQPIVGLTALFLLLVVGVFTLYKLSMEDPGKPKKKRR